MFWIDLAQDRVRCWGEIANAAMGLRVPYVGGV